MFLIREQIYHTYGTSGMYAYRLYVLEWNSFFTTVAVRDLIHDICMAKWPLNYDKFPYFFFVSARSDHGLVYSLQCIGRLDSSYV